MGEVHKFWRLDSPSMCRDFLKSLRIGPHKGKIKFLVQEDGKEVSIDNATDVQILTLANDIAEAIGDRKLPTPPLES